jgi:hypothetical protein
LVPFKVIIGIFEGKSLQTLAVKVANHRKIILYQQNTAVKVTNGRLTYEVANLMVSTLSHINRLLSGVVIKSGRTVSE